jgi:hypothetical protein
VVGTADEAAMCTRTPAAATAAAACVKVLMLLLLVVPQWTVEEG